MHLHPLDLARSGAPGLDLAARPFASTDMMMQVSSQWLSYPQIAEAR